jgi:hypothetical protein
MRKIILRVGKAVATTIKWLWLNHKQQKGVQEL